MTRSEAHDILAAMADGCSPLTGEVLPADHLLLEEPVIEALLIALEALQGKASPAAIELPHEEVLAAVDAFRMVDKKATAISLAGFFAGTSSIKLPEIQRHPLYGKYARRHAKGVLTDALTTWIHTHLRPAPVAPSEIVPHPYFQEPHFNKLSEKAILQLREKVAAIPLVKTENLSESLIERRKTFPRSHEPWPDEEMRLLKRALEFTNDLEFLASAFGRSVQAMTAQGNRLMEESAEHSA